MEPNSTYDRELINNLGEDYAQHMTVDTSEQINDLNVELEVMLAQLEEYKISLKKNQSLNEELQNQLSQISASYTTLKNAFKKVDYLEDLVKILNKDLNATESAVTKAELDLKIVPSISTTFKPFLFLKNAPPLFTTSNEAVEYQAPDLKFRSDIFFPDEPST